MWLMKGKTWVNTFVEAVQTQTLSNFSKVSGGKNSMKRLKLSVALQVNASEIKVKCLVENKSKSK